ncbi:MAG: arylsulfotransferase family protein [Chloroflexota bacterium]
MLIQHTGVTVHQNGQATPGYTLYATMAGNKVYLIDLGGNIVKQWETAGGSTNTCLLLPNGNLFVLERSEEPPLIKVAASGRMREYDPQGNIVWEHTDHQQHHDARRLPNGGAVYLAWEMMDPADAAKVQGGVPGTEHHTGGIVGEVVREVNESGDIVWEWRATSLNFEKHVIHRNGNRECYGHANTVDVLPDGNYMVSLKMLNTILIIDRQTSEIVWEYQNDALGGQHDCQLLENGNVLCFANGMFSRDLTRSSVWEIDYKTKEVVWAYKPQVNALSFFSPHVSGCQRLPSGNTLITEGAKGCIFEVTPDHDLVWEYVNPFTVHRPAFGDINWVFRSRRYAPGSPEVAQYI